jgi:sugar/nucleoside kinase (ribokinase family)
MDIDEGSGAPPDYVLVGHVARDVLGAKLQLGGTVVYAGATAARLGRRVGIVTAGEAWLRNEPAFAATAVELVPSPETTTFEHIGGPQGRSLLLLARAASIPADAVPAAWRRNSIIHLAPVANELALDMGVVLQGGTVVATLQGWMRSFAADGAAGPAVDRALDLPLECFAAAVLSAEDLAGNDKVARQIASRVPVVVVTRGADGCAVCQGEDVVEFPAFPAQVVDTTGAGDVFAAAFFIRLNETDDVAESARFATAAAALSIEGEGFSRIPDRATVAARLSGTSPCIE